MVSVPLGQGHRQVEGRFVARPSQMVLEVEVEGGVHRCHMADRGRLAEILTPDRRLVLAHRPEPGRKTQYQVLAAIMDPGPDGQERLASLDTHLPNRLVAAALAHQAFEPFAKAEGIKREVTVGHSRYDFAAWGPWGRALLEVKSAGRLDPDRVARFPDAPTSRGARHVRGLTELARAGEAAHLLFVVQGGWAVGFEPDAITDPDLTEALTEARDAGVTLHARRCDLTRAGLIWGPPLMVRLPDEPIPWLADGDIQPTSGV